jgi:hypothetical protein
VFQKTVSHRLHRGTLVPVIAGIFAILVAAPVLASSAGSGGAPSGAADRLSTGTSGVRSQQWWLSELHAQQAWRTTRGAGITVAVLSTGVSTTQPDLVGDVTTGPDYTASGRYAGGPYWGVVGTAVASIIAGHGHGTGDNSGIIGIAPQAKILSVRVTLEYNDPLNVNSAITQRLPDAIADGIIYAANHGARVIDLPLDPGTFGMAGDGAAAGGSPAERSAVRYALGKGVVLVAPAGDNGSMSGQTNYPAAYPGVVAVGATSRDGQFAWFSDRDSYVSLAAPGMDLMAAAMVPSSAYGYVPGYARISTTSAASAMVAGVAALVVAKYPQLPVSQVVRALHWSTLGSKADGTDGGTVVNAARALSAAARLSPGGGTVQGRTPPPTPVKPVKPVKPHGTVRVGAPAPKASARATAGMLAGTVLRNAVLGVCGLILLVVVVLLTTRVLTRVRRARTKTKSASALAGAGLDAAAGAGIGAGIGTDTGATAAGGRRAGRGLHKQRRGRDVVDAPAGALTGTLNTAGSLADVPMTGASVAGGALTVDPLAASSLAAGWPATTWPGEVSHSPGASRRPLLSPVPKSKRPRAAGPGSGSPPWEPAAEPDGLDGLDSPVAVRPSGWYPAEPEAGVRRPGDPPEGARPPGAFDGPDLTAPFAGRDVLTQSSFGFAAAPVPADYPASGDYPAATNYRAATGYPAATDHPLPGQPTDVFPAASDPEATLPDTPA